MPGFASNPIAYMARAALFVLASQWEGLPNALIEALAVGCPVVSTDCESGPSEILEGETWGPLAPVGDVDALAAAMDETLEKPPDREWLKAGAQRFTLDHVAERYLEILLGE
jgi:glycosyltransferase involved in cell wall biosynthesis